MKVEDELKIGNISKYPPSSCEVGFGRWNPLWERSKWINNISTKENRILKIQPKMFITFVDFKTQDRHNINRNPIFIKGVRIYMCWESASIQISSEYRIATMATYIAILIWELSTLQDLERSIYVPDFEFTNKNIKNKNNQHAYYTVDTGYMPQVKTFDVFTKETLNLIKNQSKNKPYEIHYTIYPTQEAMILLNSYELWDIYNDNTENQDIFKYITEEELVQHTNEHI